LSLPSIRQVPESASGRDKSIESSPPSGTENLKAIGSSDHVSAELDRLSSLDERAERVAEEFSSIRDAGKDAV
jgi:hypothetical protein